MKNEQVQVLMMAGGVGNRLKEVTGNIIPKCMVEMKPGYKAFDFILEELEKVGLSATFSADNYFYQYQDALVGTDHRMLWQKPGGTVEAIYQPGGTVLAIAPDCIFPYRDLPNMIASHQRGTITWAITKHKFEGMDRYEGMTVLEDGSIISRDDTSNVRAPVMIVDNDLLKHFRVPNSRGDGEDFFFDVMPRVEQENRRRIRQGKSSILNAFFLSGPIVDFGTPASLFMLRKKFNEVTNENYR